MDHIPGHGDPQASQHDCGQRILRWRQEYPDFDHGNRDSGCWRPQT